ncbi:hypothetical protein PMZ80_000746 [Knufia obscura]|uniref:Phosphoribulokinase/uridine kinase domain-containing protein n=2 Tax=Knufia TaxID=430999 RepID=A0AAN8EDU8_9EURO|nr:hypothetical protein PMZ80_000746 [Knufia obscura]KAK5949118.1 hypothetical protein OHC33_009859 [Knufia fluminis]
MDDISNQLAERVHKKYNELAYHDSTTMKERRFLIAMAGGPGSGKSSIAAEIAKAIEQRNIKCQCVELEGFMKPQSELAKMPDPQDAKDRRGAIWTFDGHAVVDLVKRCREPNKKIMAPAFDGEKRDPVPEGQEIHADAGVLIFEGIYVLANEKPWDQIAGLVDQKWFVHVDPGMQRDRVAGREVEKGIEKDMESAYRRYDTHDGRNNEYILENSVGVDIVIENNDREKTVREMHGRHPSEQ